MTTDLSRRGFLRGLVAAAVATQIATLPEPAKAEIIDGITDKLVGIYVNGQEIKNLDILCVGNGWYRVSGTFDAAESFSLHVTHAYRDPEGLFVGDKPACEAYAERHPERVAFNNLGFGPGTYTFFIYVKPGKNVAEVAMPQLEKRPQTNFIETKSCEVATTNHILWSGKK